MEKLEVVDTHSHFWDLDNPDLYYSWLPPAGPTSRWRSSRIRT